MRRFAVLGLLGVAAAGLLPAVGASAATTVAITVKVRASDDLGVDGGLSARFCTADPVDVPQCQYVQPRQITDGAFTVALEPGPWDVTFQVPNGSVGQLTAQTRAEVTTSDRWVVRLPELSRVNVEARDVDGDPLAGLKLGMLGGSFHQSVPELALSADLPAFSAEWSRRGAIANRAGEASVKVVADDDVDIPLVGLMSTPSGQQSFRVPLRTPTRTSVDATTDVVVRARELPMRKMSFAVTDHTGRPTGATSFSVDGTWTTINYRAMPGDGLATFLSPVGPTELTVRDEEGSFGADAWYLPSRWQLTQRLSLAGGDSVTLALPKPVRLQGTVTDADTGDVAPGVTVRVSPGEGVAAGLAPGLEPAQLTVADLGGKTNDDGTVQVRTFADATMSATATEQLRSEGVYRTSPTVPVDASSDGDFALTLPESVVLGVEVADASGLPVSFNARIEVSHDYLRPLVDTVPGRAEIRVTPGPIDMQMLPLCAYGFDPDRQLVIAEDTTLQYRLPELVDVTVQTLDQQGVPASSVFALRGRTTLQTDAGPELVPFSRQEDQCPVNVQRTDAQGLATVSIPAADVARVWMTSGWVYGEATGEAAGLELVGGETVVVQEGRFTRGNDDGLLARRR